MVKPCLQVFDCVIFQIVDDTVLDGDDFINPFTYLIDLSVLNVIFLKVMNDVVFRSEVINSKGSFPKAISLN